MVLVNRDPFQHHPYSSSVLVNNMRGVDLDDPAIRRHHDGSTPSGGWGYGQHVWATSTCFLLLTTGTLNTVG
eukprot:7358276-Pyramimonas_sp.AAC.1